MFKDLKDKARVKRYLIFLNIALGGVLSILLIFWFAYVRPNQISIATTQHQYGYYDMSNLPNRSGEIEVDYFGKSKVVDSQGNNDNNDSVISNDESVGSSSLLAQEELLNKSSELLEKTDKLLTSSEEKLQEPLGEGGEPVVLANEAKSQNKPKIAIIITNLGLNRKSTELALTLPTECALGFLPYTKTLKPLLSQAKNQGHEVFLYLPLQTSKALDSPGKYALTTSLAQEEIALRLHLILNSQAKYDGVYSSYKEIFTDNIKASESVFDQIADKNLIFVMGKGRTNKVERHFKIHNNIIPSNLILDEELDKKSIKLKLEALVALAEKKGVALGYSQGYVLSIEMIRDWLPSLKKRGIVLVPLSNLAMEQK